MRPVDIQTVGSHHCTEAPRGASETYPAWLLDLPKVELHVHLEGTIGPATLLRLAARHGIELGARSLDDVQALYRYRDFSHFIENFVLVSDYLRAPEDFGLVVEEYGRSLSKQGAIYAEIHFSPEPHSRRRGVDFFEMLAEMNAARLRIRGETGLELRWIADGVRDAASGSVSVDRTVDWIIGAGHGSGIVALGLGGNEHGRPAQLFADAFERAKEAGFAVVAHAGETTGSSKIWEAIDLLGVQRIGHGLSAAQDQTLMSTLADRQIPLELCPSSNIRTGLIRSIDAMPLVEFRKAGVPVSISSDDPPMFGTSLIRKLDITSKAFGLGRKDMIELSRGAILQSFADDATKGALLAKMDHVSAHPTDTAD